MRAFVGFCLVATVLCCAEVSSFAQAVPTSQTPTDQDPVATIHATTTLVEIPLLVLNQNGQIPERAPSPDSIQLRLGDGEWFRPNFVRQEGQDPIELAILLDQTSLVRDIPRPLTQALSSLSSFGLTSRDHVSLYVMDCSSVRVTNIPVDRAQVDAVRSAVEPAGQSRRQSCKEGGRLWDTLAAMTRVLRNASSRRVIFAITEGKDHASVVSQQNLAEFAQSSAVTIFDLNPADTSMFASQELRGLPLVAAASGGMRLGVESSNLRSRVQFAVSLLRNRYIAQFHLPADEKAGRVAMAARIATAPVGTFQIRLTGNSIPLPSPDGSNPQVAQMGTAPAPNPAQPVVATTVEPPPGTAVPAPIAAGPSGPGHPAVPIPAQAVNEAAGPEQVDEPWVAKTDAAVQTRPSARDSSVSTLKVNARLTLVDVTVTDRKGHPVHGLTQADFTVKEDGKEQPIKNFEEFGSEKALDATTPALPPDVYSNAPASQSTRQAVNILLFDQVSTGISRGLQPSPETLNLLKEDATRYLKTTMPAGTQVAVMAMDGSGLHLLQGFTGDRNLLVAAVSSITHQRVPDAYWAPDPGGPPPCAAANFQSGQALNALNQVALFASGVAGRKNLMWFTPGIPWLTYYPPFADVPRCVVTDYTRQMQQIFGRLTAARVAVYPIDARGLYNDPAQEATAGGRPTSNPIAFSNGVNIDEDSQEATAKATGGKAHYGNNGLGDFLSDDVATGADYYALSYVPPLEKYDGKYHTIEVKVDRPGVQLEYRRGYTSLDINGPMLEQEKSHNASAPPKGAFETAMGYGAIPETQLRFTVKAVPSTAPRQPGDASVIGSLNAELKGKPLVRYSFDFDLPRDKITLEQQPDGSHKASFELAIAAYDVQGRVLNSLDEKRGLRLNQEAVAGFLQKPFVVPVEIDLPAGEVSVRAGVMDLPSEEIGVVEIPLKVAK